MRILRLCNERFYIEKFVNSNIFKIKNIFLIGTALIFCSLLYISAQEKSFDNARFYALKKAAIQKMKGNKFRKITVEEWFENEIPVKFEKSIAEYLPPDRSRFICELPTAKGIKRFEHISVGEKLFVSYNRGKWKEYSISDNEIPGCDGITADEEIGSDENDRDSRVTIETTVERRFEKGEIVNNQMADLYETIIKTIIKQKDVYPSKNYINLSREAFWFDSSGRYVKILKEFYGGKTKIVFRTIENYEYNPKIKKIKAPIIKSKRKIVEKP